MTDTSWQEVLLRIAEIVKTVDVKLSTNTYVYLPRTLPDTNLPAVILLPREVTASTLAGADRRTETRRFNLEVYLWNARSGISGEAEESALNYGYFDLLPQKFLSRPRLELDDTGLGIQTSVGNDAGLQLLTYPIGSENSYLGFVLPLFVTRTITSRFSR